MLFQVTNIVQYKCLANYICWQRGTAHIPPPCCSSRSISPVALQQTDTLSFHRPCCAYFVGSASNCHVCSVYQEIPIGLFVCSREILWSVMWSRKSQKCWTWKQRCAELMRIQCPCDNSYLAANRNTHTLLHCTFVDFHCIAAWCSCISWGKCITGS